MIRTTTCAGLPLLLAIAFCPAISPAAAQSPGFFLNDWQAKTAGIPAYELVEKPAVDPSVHVTVDPANIVNKVPQYIYGNNAVTWDDGLRRNSTAMADLKNLDPHVLRWPGGNLSNVYFWNASYNNRPADVPDYVVNDHGIWYGQDCPDWQQSADEYYGLLEKTNSTGIICVNYSYARYGTGPNPVATAAHMAADWVRYDNGRSKFWEIGNENFGNWQSGYEIDVTKNQDGQPRFISGQLYGQHCRVFIDSMRAAAAEIGADIKIGVVAYDAENSWDPISQVWNEGMMPEVGDLADFLIVHSYFTPYNEDSPVNTILNSHVVPGEIMEAIESDMAEAGKTMLPVAMTEWNIFAVGSMQQVSYINGMLAAITLGEYVQHDYGLSTRWDLVNGWSNGNDHGLFSVGGEPGVDPYNPRAAFFYMYYHQRFFGDRMVASEVSGSSNVIAHASTFTSGETGLVLVNKGRSYETVQVDINGTYGLQYYHYTLTGGTDNGDFSRKVLINGIEDPDEEGGGPDNYASIKAKASGTFGGIKVALPPLSVVYLLTDKEAPLSYAYSKIDTNASVINVYFTEEIADPDDASGFGVLVNGSEIAITGVETNPRDASILHLYLANDLQNGDVITLDYSGNSVVSLADGTPLQGFADAQVDNQLPPGPLDFAFQVIHRSSGALIEGCQVTFNGETKNTDGNGEAYFTAVPGLYTVAVAKTHLDPVSDFPVEVLESTTTIPVYVDSTLYNVTFLVVESKTGDPLSFTTVTVGSQTETTDQDGRAVFALNAGARTGKFSKTNFSELNHAFVIDSDAEFEVGMTRSHAEVKFRLKNGQQPVVGAAVTLSGETLTSNPVGTVLFPSVIIDEDQPYSITRDNYFTLDGTINIASDTTIELQMNKSVANITFVVTAETGTITSAFAVILTDTAWFNTENRATFYNMELLTEHQYIIESDHFETASGAVYLEGDTTLQVMLTPSAVSISENSSPLKIYPNPARSHIFIEQEAGNIREVAIMDITGKQVLQQNFQGQGQAVQINLGCTPGLYFLKVSSETETVTRRLTIR